MTLTHPAVRLPRSAVPVLSAVASGEHMGTVYRSGDARLTFVYTDAWLNSPDSYPLSLSMPLTSASHGNGTIKPWLWGLMPDDPKVLEGWGKRFGISTVDIVGLLTKVGEECAGAVQFIEPGELSRLLSPANESEETALHWIDQADIARRLRELRVDASSGRRATDIGRFSLAGAQPKTALYESPSGQWGVPSGRWPTNRILKPPVLDLHAFAWNEHLCLDLAHRLGWSTARSSVRTFADDVGSEQAIVVERYDRITRSNTLLRVHQEDCCQALRVPPTRKYESQGGPSVERIAALLSASSSASTTDRARLLDAMAFNWIIGGTDAHAKNFAILLAAQRQVRLAPLYDVISVLPYPQLMRDDNTLAMAIGGERRLAEITGTHWERLGSATGAGAHALRERVAEVATGVIEAATAMQDERRGTPFVDVLMPAIVSHAHACRERLTSTRRT